VISNAHSCNVIKFLFSFSPTFLPSMLIYSFPLYSTFQNSPLLGQLFLLVSPLFLSQRISSFHLLFYIIPFHSNQLTTVIYLSFSWYFKFSPYFIPSAQQLAWSVPTHTTFPTWLTLLLPRSQQKVSLKHNSTKLHRITFETISNRYYVSTQLLCRNKVSVENSEPEKGSILKTRILKSEL
jgi:hypothetical protein